MLVFRYHIFCQLWTPQRLPRSSHLRSLVASEPVLSNSLQRGGLIHWSSKKIAMTNKVPIQSSLMLFAMTHTNTQIRCQWGNRSQKRFNPQGSRIKHHVRRPETWFFPGTRIFLCVTRISNVSLVKKENDTMLSVLYHTWWKCHTRLTLLIFCNIWLPFSVAGRKQGSYLLLSWNRLLSALVYISPKAHSGHVQNDLQVSNTVLTVNMRQMICYHR